MTQFSRRGVIASAAGLAFTGLARASHAANTTPAQVQADRYTNEVAGYGPLRTDPFGLFDLPGGFSYTVIGRAGEPMSDGLVTPYKADGMGCFPLDRDRVILVRNHELKLTDVDYGPFGVGHGLVERVDPTRIFDHGFDDGRALNGGTTTMVYNLRSRRMEDIHLSLVGTSTNCAGGVTPWGSWLTCEEIVQPAGKRADNLPSTLKSHGWVFEVPSRAPGLVAPIPLTGLGRFKHEAACIDPRTGILYETEDEQAGLFYRFLPNDRRNLAAGGRLQALGFKDSPAGGDSRNWTGADWALNGVRDVVWIDLDATDNPDNDLAKRGQTKGAAFFARGEGVFFGAGELFFTCTSGGPGKLGQIMRYTPSRFEGQSGERDEPGKLQLFVQPTDKSVMMMPDNIAIAPWGHLIVCEDKAEAGAVNYLKGVTPQGRVYTIGRQALPGASDVGANTELAGICFSPEGTTMFVNAYWPGATLAITGPWGRLAV